MGKWLNGCEICNIGLVTEVNKLKEAGLSERAACRKLSELAEKKFKTPMWSEQVILDRYRYHFGLNKKETVYEIPTQPTENHNNNNDLYLVPGKKVLSAAEPEEFGASYYSDIHKAVARANEPQTTELEKAEKIIVKASRLLSDIVDGNLKDTGTDYDRLAAASIKRHGPGIIISFIQLGIDVHKVYDFYKGDSQVGRENQKLECKRNLRLSRDELEKP